VLQLALSVPDTYLPSLTQSINQSWHLPGTASDFCESNWYWYFIKNHATNVHEYS